MRKFLIILSCALCTQLNAQIPNQNYSNNELLKIISPQMGTRHLNQPSVISGHVMLAGNGRHQVWNISNPYQPKLVKEFSSSFANGEAESHQVSYMKDAEGNLYFVTISGKGIDIWEINDITNPKYMAAMELPNINYGDVSNAVWGISCQGNMIYVGATNHGLYIVDAKDKSNPVLVKTMSTAEIGGISAGPIFNIGNLLVVTTPKQTAGIATLNISDSSNPKLLDSYKPKKEPWKSYIGGFYGKYATLINPFRLIDVTTDPSNITVVSTTVTEKSEYVSFDDNHLFLGGLRGGSEGIWKYDISNPSNPQLIGRVKGRDSRWDDQFNVPVGNLVVIADDQYVNGFVGAVIAVHDTKKDTTPPRVIYTNPKNGDINQPLSSKIGISLSSWINFDKVDANSFKVRKIGGANVQGSFGHTYTTLSFEPSQPLAPNTEYEVVLEGNEIQDLVGNNLGNNYIFRFTTGKELISSEDVSIESPKAINVGENVSWKVINSNQNYTYTWDTGNGEKVSGVSPTYNYNQSGRFNVVLSAFESSDIYMEAEAGTTSGDVNSSSGNTGYSGSGYLDFPSTTGTDVYAEIQFDNEVATNNGVITIRYAMGAGGSRPLNLSINGSAPIKVDFSSTGGWTTYKDAMVTNVSLPKGMVKVRLSATAGSQGGNIDRFKIVNDKAQPRLVTTLAFNQIVNSVSTPNPSKSSTQFAKVGETIWVVNEDANTISSISQNSLQKINEVVVGKKPVAISSVGNNRVWVLNKDDATISIINTNTAAVISNIALPHGSKPSALVVNNELSRGYISLESLGKVLEITTTNNTITKELKIQRDSNGILPKPGALAIDGDGKNLYITRFVSENAKSEIYKVATTSFNNYSTISLKESTGTDGALFARGIPNYLTHIAIAPDGNSLRIASKKDNIKRGEQRDGLPLEHDNIVRAIVSNINLTNDTDDVSKRLDIDNSDRCHSVTYSNNGNVVFIAMPGNNEIFVADANSNAEIARLITDEVPTHMLYDKTQKRLYVNNFLGRSVSVFDVRNIIDGGATSSKLATISTVSNELLSPEILKGKKLFYDASSTKLSQEGYVSCASCHLDGGNDGQVWDFTNFGEGFRNTIDLVGKAGTAHGRLHWTANFDEIHDFENQIRTLNKGTGLMPDQQFNNTKNPLGNTKAGKSSDLDALSTYITSLNSFSRSPYRQANGALTAKAENGQRIFADLKCFECHSGQTYTNSSTSNNLFDVGTIVLTSGERIDKKLLGIDVPTLKGLWETAPYLHDGSAATLLDVLTTKNSEGKHANVSGLAQSELNDLIEYMKQLDDTSPDAPTSTLNLAVTTPVSGQVFNQGTDINIGITSGISNIQNVEYYINNTLVANETVSPYTYVMINATSGNKEVIVKAFYGNGTAIVSECLEFEVTTPVFIADGTYYMKKATTELYLKANGIKANTTSIDNNTSEDTQWKFKNLGNGEYSITSVTYPNARLEVLNGKIGRGSLIATTDVTGQADYLVWKAQKVGENFLFIPKHDQLRAIDLYQGNTIVHTWDKDVNNTNQVISLIPTKNDNQFIINARGIDGDESITLTIDGQEIQTWTLSKTAQNYTASTSLTGNVRVLFTNNAGTRDAFIDYISINNNIIQSEDRSVNTAVWQNGSCGNGGNSQWMNCNGYIDFGDSSTALVLRKLSIIENAIVGYPNPTKSVLYLNGIPVKTKIGLSVINVLGETVVSNKFISENSIHELNVSKLEAGLYYLILHTYNGREKEVIRFVKQ